VLLEITWPAMGANRGSIRARLTKQGRSIVKASSRDKAIDWLAQNAIIKTVVGAECGDRLQSYALRPIASDITHMKNSKNPSIGERPRYRGGGSDHRRRTPYELIPGSLRSTISVCSLGSAD